MNQSKRMPWLVLLAVLLGMARVCLATAEDPPIVIRGGTFLTATGAVIENGRLLIEQGKITAIGLNIAIPDRARIIEAGGHFITPGLIDAFTNLGIARIETGENDSDEAAEPLTPQLDVYDALDPDNEFISLARESGVTMALVAPVEGNLLAGRSALVRLLGSTVEEMKIDSPAAGHGSLGEIPKMRFGPNNRLPSTRMGEAAMLRQTLVDASQYMEKIQKYEHDLINHRQKEKAGKARNIDAPVPPDPDAKLQALMPVLKGEQPLVLRANRLDDILSALRIAAEFRLRLIISGGADAHKVADRLAAAKIPVILAPLSLPHQRLETRGEALENAARLQRAGVRIAFQTGSFRQCQQLLAQAQLAVAGGLSQTDALRALTLNPAEIFGVADRFGSLTVGKSADLVIFSSDPFSGPARVVTVIINGRPIESRSRRTP